MIAVADKSDDGGLVLSRYMKALSELQTFVKFSWFGLHHLAGEREFAAGLVRATERSELDDAALEQNELFKTLIPPKDLENFALAQKSSEFHYLYSIAVVRLWSIVESAVDDVILDLIGRVPAASLPEKIRSLRGPLIEFSEASLADQAAFIMDLLKQDLKAALKPGVGRFEVLLDVVGRGGPVDTTVRRTLLELSQLRNVLVHKDGKADKRLVEACPWLSVDKGETVHVRSSDFGRYLCAVYWYIGELIRRCVPVWANNPEDHERFRERSRTTQELWLQRLKEIVNGSPTAGDQDVYADGV